jgi:hypothetical protein
MIIIMKARVGKVRLMIDLIHREMIERSKILLIEEKQDVSPS